MKWRLHIERKGPLVIAALIGLFHAFLARKCYPTKDSELFSNVANLSGIAVGFLATGQALLFSLSENRVVKLLKKLNQFDLMMKNFTVAIWACLVLSVYTLLSCCVSFKELSCLFSFWLFLVAYATLTTLRSLWYLGGILHGDGAN